MGKNRTIFAEIIANQLGVDIDPDFMDRIDLILMLLALEGFAVLPSQATYFLNVDLAASGIAISDRDFCLRCVIDHGVAAIPLSALYEQDPQMSLIRLCFAKPDETLDEGARRLGAARAALA